MSISIIIPVYNEELNVENTFDNLLKAIKFVKLFNYEIIFINDGSTDNSLKIIKRIEKKSKKILLINNLKNLGLSLSIFKSISSAKKKFIWWLPSDNNLDYKEISKIISNYSNLDFILTKHIMKRPFFREVISRGYTALVNAIFFLNIPYFNCLFFIKREILKKIKVRSKSQFWMAELTIKLLRASRNYEIRTLKLTERKSGTSKIFNFKQFLLTIKDLLTFRIYLN
jgi:dolichol-phosphate mannosyltransferase